MLTVEEAFESKKPSTYQFQMDGCGKDFTFVVDAFSCGNEGISDNKFEFNFKKILFLRIVICNQIILARFINHSCNPNLVVRSVFADRLDLRYHRIAFFAKRDIRQGEELTIDYCAIDQYAKGRRKKKCQ